MLPLIGERSTASLSGPYAQSTKIGPDIWCMLHVLMTACPIVEIRAILVVVHGFRCTAEQLPTLPHKPRQMSFARKFVRTLPER